MWTLVNVICPDTCLFQSYCSDHGTDIPIATGKGHAKLCERRNLSTYKIPRQSCTRHSGPDVLNCLHLLLGAVCLHLCLTQQNFLNFLLYLMGIFLDNITEDCIGILPLNSFSTFICYLFFFFIFV